MLSALYYLFLVLLCTFFMLLSAVALVVCWPFDRARRVVHFLSRVLVRIFFAVPPFWRQRVEGLGRIDRRRPYVIVVNHNTVIDIPALYYIPLNFRWVSKREVFRTPFSVRNAPTAFSCSAGTQPWKYSTVSSVRTLSAHCSLAASARSRSA